ncbi:c-type cytochrome [uncultured Roseibium sp.]|uniref:c-type cytochrome n=1 Tax=uncultured Roseibium sp. TaxID=1936171 RepID=UPI003216F7BF
MRTNLPLIAATLIALSCVSYVPPVLAGGSVERGKAVIEQWCRTCHQQAGDTPNPDMAPPYEQIVLRPDHTRAYFMQFLKEDHFPMTTYRLFDSEREDVVAYLMALQQSELNKRGGN